LHTSEGIHETELRDAASIDSRQVSYLQRPEFLPGFQHSSERHWSPFVSGDSCISVAAIAASFGCSIPLLLLMMTFNSDGIVEAFDEELPHLALLLSNTKG
jgi:hypothetical protein